MKRRRRIYRDTDEYRFRNSPCHTSNPTEAGVARHLEDEGYEVFNKGWPDFLAYHPETGEIRFIEVKPDKRGELVRPEQRRVAEILSKLGVRVELCTPQHPKPPRAAHELPPGHRFAGPIHALSQRGVSTVAIVGSRVFHRSSAIETLIRALPQKVAIYSGGAKGVDRAVATFAAKHRRAFTEIPADWNRHGRSAGILRNRDLVGRVEVVVAFWDLKSKGTAFTIREAIDKRRSVFVYGPDLEPVEPTRKLLSKI